MFVEDWFIYPKLAYLTMGMVLYSTYVYTPSYFEAIWSVPTHGYGYISSICVLSLGGSIIWSRISERKCCPKLVLFICTLFYSVLFGLLWLEKGADLDNELIRMLIVILLYGGSSAFGGAISPILDHLVFEYLQSQEIDAKELYGRQRLWSSIGHAIIVTINGWGIQNFGFDSMFICLLVSTVLFMMSLSFLKITKKRKDTSDPPKEVDMTRKTPVPAPTAIFVLIFHPTFALFLISILMAGFVRCVVGAFGPVYFKKVLQMSHGTYGIAMQTRLLPEILVFFFGKGISSRYDNNALMMIGQVAGVLRSAVYGVIPKGPKYSWITYPIEMLKGINNAGIMMAGPRMAYDFAPVGSETTVLAIFHGVYSSLAMIAAGIAGGQILRFFGDDATGFKNLFMITTLSGLISILVLGFLKIHHNYH